MTRYVAFLRAINIRTHIVKMHELRRLFESMGLANVETYIQSGNVIFDSAVRKTSALENKIEKQLHEALGFEVVTFLRPISELAELIRNLPFPDYDANAGDTLYVVFLKESPSDEARRRFMALEIKEDILRVGRREVFWLRRSRHGESAMQAGLIEKALRGPGTSRNLTTVLKIVDKYGAP